MKKLKLPIIIIVIVAWLAVECNPTPSSSFDTIIFISLDTTRADYIGTYGYRLTTTPNIDAL